MSLFFAAYTQVVTLTVYTYLFSNLFGHQFLEPGNDKNEPSEFEEIGITIANKPPYMLVNEFFHYFLILFNGPFPASFSLVWSLFNFQNNLQEIGTHDLSQSNKYSLIIT